jgi:hypothetical protein
VRHVLFVDFIPDAVITSESIDNRARHHERNETQGVHVGHDFLQELRRKDSEVSKEQIVVKINANASHVYTVAKEAARLKFE